MIQAVPAVHDLSLEMAAAGATLLNEQDRLACLEILKSEMFADERARTIFECVRDLALDGEYVDAVTVLAKLDLEGKRAKAGGVEFLYRLVDETPSHNAIDYAKKLSAHTYKGRMIAALKKTHEEIVTGKLDNLNPEIVFSRLLEVAGITEHTKSLYWVRELLEDFDFKRPTASESGDAKSGLTQLDQNINLFKPSNFTVVAARPGVGKSTLMRQMALEASRVGPVLIFTLEESKEAQRDKMLCTIARVPYWDWYNGRLTDDQNQHLAQAMGQLAELPIAFFGGYDCDTARIRLCIKRMVEQGKKPITVLVDHLQLMKHSRAESRDAAVGETTRLLRLMSLEFNVSVVLLCQMNRGIESRGGDDKRPKLSDLRESGNIEANAPNVIFLWRKDEQEKDSITLTLAKHRDGPTTEMQLVFLKAHGRLQAAYKV